LGIGIPFALILAWEFELTPEGVGLTSEVDPADSALHRIGQALNTLIISALSLAVVFLIVDSDVPGGADTITR
jgi:adenylate cyclase